MENSIWNKDLLLYQFYITLYNIIVYYIQTFNLTPSDSDEIHLVLVRVLALKLCH